MGKRTFRNVDVVDCQRGRRTPNGQLYCEIITERNTHGVENVDRIETEGDSERKLVATPAGANLTFREDLPSGTSCVHKESPYGHQIIECE